jgi:hypothetical protein
LFRGAQEARRRLVDAHRGLRGIGHLDGLGLAGPRHCDDGHPQDGDGDGDAADETEKMASLHAAEIERQIFPPI